MTEAEYRDALEELDRQIALAEEFLKQRKKNKRHDSDLKSKLDRCIRERDALRQAGPAGGLSVHVTAE